MLSKRSYTLIIGTMMAMIIICIALSSWLLVKNNKTASKTAYVNIVELFNRFEMKKELQTKLKKSLMQKQNVLDSIMFQLKAFKSKLEAKKHQSKEELLQFQNMQNYYIQQKKITDEYQQDKTDQFNHQILDQMKQYVKDYGKKEKYDYIFGLNSAGNIMYGVDRRNITKEVIKYINDSYQGKN